MSDGVRVVDGPGVGPQQELLYQVTLPTGVVLTGPDCFGESTPVAAVYKPPVIASDGRVLIRCAAFDPNGYYA